MLVRSIFLLFSVIAAGAAHAMSTTHYLKTDTTLHPDGSIERQVQIKTVSSGRGDSKSESTRSHSGVFSSAADIPDYLHVDVKPTKFVRRYTRTDYVFVTEHEFEEVPVDTVHPEEVHEIIGKLAQLVVAVYREAIEETLHKDYDGSALVHWLENDLVVMFHEQISLYLYYESILNSEAKDNMDTIRLSGEYRERAIEIYRRHGLDPSEFYDEDSVWFLAPPVDFKGKLSSPLLQRFIRKKSGETITADDLDRLWKRPPMAAFEKKDPDTIGRKYRDVLEERMIDVMLGGCLIFCDVVKFHYSMAVPGSVVETTGRLRSDNRVEWSFDDQHAYLTGFRMWVRSLEANLETQTTLTGRQPFQSREAVFDFVALVAEDEDLQRHLQQSRAENRLRPELPLALGHHFRDRGSSDAWFWYCKAASAGSHEASRVLAHWHREERDETEPPTEFLEAIDPDDRAAYVWYTLAEQAGDLHARQARDAVVGRLTAYERNVAERMAREWTPDKCPWPW